MKRILATVLLALLLGACASGAAQRSGSRNLILQEELSRAPAADLLVAVRALRPHWVRTPPQRSLQSNEQVWVYLDGQRLGGVDQLRQIAPSTVLSVEFLPGFEAQQKWGLDHAQGVISVSSRR